MRTVQVKEVTYIALVHDRMDLALMRDSLESVRMQYGEQEQHWANRQLLAELDHILLGHE